MPNVNTYSGSFITINNSFKINYYKNIKSSSLNIQINTCVDGLVGWIQLVVVVARRILALHFADHIHAGYLQRRVVLDVQATAGRGRCAAVYFVDQVAGYLGLLLGVGVYVCEDVGFVCWSVVGDGNGGWGLRVRFVVFVGWLELGRAHFGCLDFTFL